MVITSYKKPLVTHNTEPTGVGARLKPSSKGPSLLVQCVKELTVCAHFGQQDVREERNKQRNTSRPAWVDVSRGSVGIRLRLDS